MQNQITPFIIKESPQSVEKDKSVLSALDKIFDQFANHQEERLRNSGYNEKLKYEPETRKTDKETETQHHLVLSTLYSTSIKNNIGKHFLHHFQNM